MKGDKPTSQSLGPSSKVRAAVYGFLQALITIPERLRTSLMVAACTKVKTPARVRIAENLIARRGECPDVRLEL